MFPKEHPAMKEEILAKVPFSLEEYRRTAVSRRKFPWLAVSFAAVALVIFVGQNFLPSGRLVGRNGLTIPISQ